jgi:hypothetical protein
MRPKREREPESGFGVHRRSDHRHGKFSRARYTRRYRKNNARARARACDREFAAGDRWFGSTLLADGIN